MKKSLLVSAILASTMLVACSNDKDSKPAPTKGTPVVQEDVSPEQAVANLLQDGPWLSNCVSEAYQTSSWRTEVDFQDTTGLVVINKNEYKTSDCSDVPVKHTAQLLAYEVEGTDLGLDKNARLQFYNVVNVPSGRDVMYGKGEPTLSYMAKVNGATLEFISSKEETFFGVEKSYTRKAILDLEKVQKGADDKQTK